MGDLHHIVESEAKKFKEKHSFSPSYSRAEILHALRDPINAVKKGSDQTREVFYMNACLPLTILFARDLADTL
jgi:hypothetical protein